MIWLPVVGKWSDIDCYASIIAYTDLLNQRGKPAKAYIPSAPNYSVPDSLRVKTLEQTNFDLQPDDKVIILDISIPEIIHQFVPNHQILELIDHHPGYESYWQKALGKRAIIEKIGAVATSIFEWWGECWDYQKMSPDIAKLLLGAILDNTLNFNAEITTDRDQIAAEQLAKISQTTLKNFTNWYFSTVSETILKDLSAAILDDTKPVKIPTAPAPITFGQLALWDAKSILSDDAKLKSILDSQASDWILSVLSIAEGKNYLLTSSDQILTYFTKLLQLKPEGNYNVTNRLYLRKEILAKILES